MIKQDPRNKESRAPYHNGNDRYFQQSSGLSKAYSDNSAYMINSNQALKLLPRDFGLHNANGHFNCYLNVGLQLLWHIDSIREPLNLKLAEARKNSDVPKLPEFQCILALYVRISMLMFLSRTSSKRLKRTIEEC
jgi:hypothetical protein